MLRLNIVQMILPPKSILILNILRIPKCCCAQILLFGYFGTGKVMLPVILISLVCDNANGVDRQRYEKGRSGKDGNLTELSQVPTASCDFMGINRQNCIFCTL